MTGNPKPEQNSACSGSNAEEEAEVQGEESPFCRKAAQGVTLVPRAAEDSQGSAAEGQEGRDDPEPIPRATGLLPEGGSEAEQPTAFPGGAQQTCQCMQDRRLPSPTAAQTKKNPSRAPRTSPSLCSRRPKPAAELGRAITRLCWMEVAEPSVTRQPFLGIKPVERSKTSSIL